MIFNLTALISDPKKFNALCKPSTFKSDNPLIVYALSNLKDDEEAAPFAASAHSSAITRALQHSKNIFLEMRTQPCLKITHIAVLLVRCSLKLVRQVFG
jgi:hypothetical protein